jgi:hypothetical protein
MNLSAKQSQFIHNNCHVTDDYNYKIEAAELTLSDLMGTEVSQQEVQVLTRTPAEKAVIGKLGKELKSLNPNNPILETARKDWVNPKGGFFHIKQLLNNAIQIEKSTKLVFSALAKINA